MSSVLFPRLARYLLIGLLLLAVLPPPLAGQLATPPFNPAEPRVLGRQSQGLRERLDTRKWRRRYNQYELIVLVWQLYHARKQSGDWKAIFREITGAMSAELGEHQAFYNGLSRADALVTSYYLIDDIRKEFRAIVRIVPALVDATADPAIWTDPDQVEFIRRAAREIQQQASKTLRYVPLVADVEIDTWEGVADLGIEPVEEKYWASSADRLQQLDRMHTELRTLRTLLDGLHRRAQQTATHRRAELNERTRARIILGMN